MNLSALPAVEAKLADLCAAIAAEPEVIAAREKAEAFLADEAAVNLYREMITLGRSLEQRDRSGAIIPDADVQTFEVLQMRVEAHDGIRAFSEAQEVLQGVGNMVNAFVSSTLEKGKVPTAEELFGGGGCGEGCGCHH